MIFITRRKFRGSLNLDRVPGSYIQLDAPVKCAEAVRMMLLPIFLAIHAVEDDSGLVARMQRRDPQALAELYDRYGRVTYALILRVVRDVGIAEDLVQETFLRVWNRVHGFDAQKGSIGPWLLAVARNRAIDYLRSAGGRERNALEFEETDHPALYTNMEHDILTSDSAR